MTHRQQELARAVFKAIFQQAKKLSIGQLILLRSVYANELPFDQLTPELKDRFLQVGVDVVTAVSKQNHG